MDKRFFKKIFLSFIAASFMFFSLPVQGEDSDSGQEELVQRVLQLLDSEDLSEQQEGVTQCLELHDERLNELLMRVLTEHPDRCVKGMAIYALSHGNVRSEAFFNIVAEVATVMDVGVESEPSSRYLLHAALETLGLFRDRGAEILMELGQRYDASDRRGMTEYGNGSFGVTIIRSLGRTGFAGASTYLHEALQQYLVKIGGEDWRAQIHEILSQAEYRAGFITPLGATEKEIQEALSRYEEGEERYDSLHRRREARQRPLEALIEAVGQINSESSRDILLDLFKNRRIHRRIRLLAAQALVLIGDDSSNSVFQAFQEEMNYQRESYIDRVNRFSQETIGEWIESIRSRK